MMKTRAAVLRKGGQPWEITELDLDEPKAGEVLIRFEAAGLCHSDEHIRATGTARLPLVGGHEGAGVIEATGPGVTRVADRRPGGLLLHPRLRHLPVLLHRPPEPVRRGQERRHRLPDRRHLPLPRQRPRTWAACAWSARSPSTPCISEWSCVKIEDDIPFELAALVSCGVTTGFCSATKAATCAPATPW